jgi:hypothetical protein
LEGVLKDQRKVSNIFVKSSLIAKYGKLVLIAWGIAIAISLFGHWYLTSSIADSILPLISSPEKVQAEALFQKFLVRTLAVNVLVFTGLIWSILAFLTLMNHRIFGPIDVLSDFIGHLKAGNFDPPKRSLRQNDELKPLMQELNDLADSLKNP